MIAIGIGCKKGCSSEAIVALVRSALARAGRPGGQATLFTHIEKAREPGLSEAAERLALPLVFFEAATLRQAAARVATSSPKVMALFGLPSIAETAALAGAGPDSFLLAPRMSEAGASCAIAGTREP